MKKFRYTFALTGIIVACFSSTLLTLQRGIWDNYWRGWLAYLLLLFCTSIAALVFGLSIDLILFFINRRRTK